MALPLTAAVKAFSFASGAFSYVSFQILAGKLLLLVLSPTLPHPSLPCGVEKEQRSHISDVLSSLTHPAGSRWSPCAVVLQD